MSIIDLMFMIINLRATIGCLVGIGAAAGLHWAFPNNDLVLLQAVVIAVFTLIGLYIDLAIGSRPKDEKYGIPSKVKFPLVDHRCAIRIRIVIPFAVSLSNRTS